MRNEQLGGFVVVSAVKELGYCHACCVQNSREGWKGLNRNNKPKPIKPLWPNPDNHKYEKACIK